MADETGRKVPPGITDPRAQVFWAVARCWMLRPDADPEPMGDTLPTLTALQAAVGGYVEHITLDNLWGSPAHLFANEDGWRHRLPLNEWASTFYRVGSVGGVVMPALTALEWHQWHALRVVGAAVLWLGDLDA